MMGNMKTFMTVGQTDDTTNFKGQNVCPKKENTKRSTKK